MGVLNSYEKNKNFSKKFSFYIKKSTYWANSPINTISNRPKYDIVILLCKNYYFVYRRKITSLFISSTQQALKEKPV